jgi:uncharacterized membrane protein
LVVRVARGHRRLSLAMTLTAATFGLLVAMYGRADAVTWLLLGWDVGVAFYLVATAAMMARSTAAEIERHSQEQDEGAFALLVVTVTAAVASLAAIFVVLGSLTEKTPHRGAYGVLAITTVALSWAMIHTIFALHYAYEYYGDDDRAGGLKFPDDDKPDYWDFVYFAFVIGMTFQVSDVAVTNKAIRRMVVVHGVLSFFFTAAIIALTVNIASNVIQK